MHDLVEYPCFEAWREDETDRAEDAANLFGLHLIRHCRQDALRSVASAGAEGRRAAEQAVDMALHGAMALLEGFWHLPAGEGLSAELVLRIDITRDGELVESQEISPSKLDLPMGYWSWVEKGMGN